MYVKAFFFSEPLLQFNQSVYHVSENDGYFHAAISRSGNLIIAFHYLLCVLLTDLLGLVCL